MKPGPDKYLQFTQLQMKMANWNCSFTCLASRETNNKKRKMAESVLLIFTAL